MTITEGGLQAVAGSSPVADGLASAFDLAPKQLRQIARALMRGDVILRQMSVRLQPYIGPSQDRMAEMGRVAKSGGLARDELQRIRDHHMANRFTPLMRFLLQLPSEWRPMLLAGIRSTVTGIEFKTSGNKVIDILVWHSSTLYEYGLQEGFTLTFTQVQEISAWMRENEDLLPTFVLKMPPLTNKGDEAAEGARWAAMIAFFDNFPEKMRNLLFKKANSNLTTMRFQALPTGVVVTILTFA
jgi:hypothetical protein